MTNKPSSAGNEQLQTLRSIFAETFQQITKHSTPPEIIVSFYPFAGLNHTIRLRNQKLYVRVSDLLQDAPRPVFFALAKILLGKLFRRRPNEEAEKLYRDYIYQPQMVQASEKARQQRGRKQLRGAEGKYYDLTQIFGQLNHDYFAQQLSQPKLSWSQRPNKRILGHYDAIHDAIVISCSLDRKQVPPYVIMYVMYHEMLHIKHPTRVVNGIRRYHPAAFRVEEKLFRYYDAAITWLEQHISRR